MGKRHIDGIALPLQVLVQMVVQIIPAQPILELIQASISIHEQKLYTFHGTEILYVLRSDRIAEAGVMYGSTRLIFGSSR